MHGHVAHFKMFFENLHPRHELRFFLLGELLDSFQELLPLFLGKRLI